jgi:hypothetical protein
MVVVPAVRVTVDVKNTVVVGSGSDSDALLFFVSVVLRFERNCIPEMSMHSLGNEDCRGTRIDCQSRTID